MLVRSFSPCRLGWDVELDAAKIDLGPFYFNIDPPNTSQFRSGVVIAESLRQVTVDALNPALVSVTEGVGGQTGTAVAVELDLFPPDSTITDPDVGGPAGNGSAYLAGVATLAGKEVPFKGGSSSIQTWHRPMPPCHGSNARERRGVRPGFRDEQRPADVARRPTTWFDGANFASLLPAGPDGGSDGGLSDGGPSGPYGWTDVSAFEAAVLNQIQATTGVYTFALTSQ